MGEVQRERVQALNQCLARTVVETEEIEIDTIETGAEENSILEAARKEAEQIKKLQTLFKGKKFFLGREIPREPLVFMIRAFGGQVSWDNTAAPGSTYQVDEASITHQICDRPRDTVDMKHSVSRDYVQPQWVFDSINRREELPVHKYFVGEPLPPHLSPFIKEERRVGDYVPPEEKEMLGLNAKKEVLDQDKQEESEEEEEEAEGEEGSGSEEESEEEEEETEVEKEEVKNMKVERGKPEIINKDEVKENMEKEEFRLREMMIKKKHKGLYKSMMKHRKKRVNESKQLERKRKMHDDSMAAMSNPSKKQKT